MGNDIKSKKRKKRLAKRIADYEVTLKNRPPFDMHKPGSNNK